MIQQRQLRKEHQDTHYASAIFRYQKEMAVKLREHSEMLCVDDKHKIKVGEPGHPVAAVERGKKVLIGLNQSFEVSDHDFTKQTLTPSVALRLDIPETIEGSFYQGQVYTALKDSVFQSSSPLRHATEIMSMLKEGEKPLKEVLFLYSDGGPDHRVNYLSVQLSLISAFLEGDFDAVIAARTPPGHSWKNPCERIMSILNLALQAVGVMRQKLSPEMEALLAKCNSVADIRSAATTHPALKGSLSDGLQDTICLISSLFRQLKLKGVPFRSFTPVTTDDMDGHHNHVLKIDAQLPQNATMKDLKKSDSLKNFFEKHCQLRHYSFCVLKCSDPECGFHKPPRLTESVFKDLHFLPDPIMAADGIHYKGFTEIYGTPTTEC
ncbi:uncharacterized protein [Antedon mediterranea]|uniref:uncharacterized protein n=1 Tax=Antedon mediterranea TaxID=105859 RepID=UPI003AF55543